MLHVLARAAFGLCFFGLPVASQSIQHVYPAAASPGSLLTIRGANLATVSAVRFHAQVGGIVGIMTVEVPLLSLGNTQITVSVPEIPGWVPPTGVARPDPLGSIELVAALGTATPATAPFYFFEGTDGFLANAGLGTTQSAGGRPWISFALETGPPEPGNADFTARVDGLATGALPVLAVALPLSPPYPPIGDGLLVIDPSAVFVLIPGSPSTGLAPGSAFAPLSIPSSLEGCGCTIALQWGHIDPGTSSLVVSNAILASY